MIRVENIEVHGFPAAVRGARNAMNSWDKSDSKVVTNYADNSQEFVLGENDLELAKRLIRAGDPSHRKFLRMIHVSMDITSNHTFLAQLDTYKVGVTRNSCSKMHKIHVKEFTVDDFSHEGLDAVGGMSAFDAVVNILNEYRMLYNQSKDKNYWRAMIDLLPMGYNLRATFDMNYENVLNIIRQRRNHKMIEWSTLILELLRLPYMEDFWEAANATRN